MSVMERSASHRVRYSVVVLLILGMAPRASWAQSPTSLPSLPPAALPSATGGGDVFKLSLRDLLSTKVRVTSKRDESISRSPGIVTTVHMRDLRRMGIRTLKDALELLPNVVVVATPVGTSSVSIRGLSETFNQKVLFLLEGIPYWMPSHGDIPLLGMPLELIDRIEIIRGPGSVIYGTNASGGVINVILNKRANLSEVVLSGGNQGTLRADAHASYTHDGGYAYFGASVQRQLNGYAAFFPETRLVPPFSGAAASYPTSGTLIKREEHASLVAGLHHGGLDLLFHLFESTTNGLGGAPVIFQPNTLRSFGTLLHAAYTHRRRTVEFHAGIDHNIYFLRIETANFLADVDSDGIVRSSAGRQQYENPLLNNSRTRLSLSAKVSLTEGLSWLFGAEEEVRRAGRYIKTDDRDQLIAEQSAETTVNEASLYTQLDWQFRRLRLVAGVRIVHNSLAGGHLAPRASAIFSLDQQQSLKLLYSEGFNSPVISQQDLLIPFVVAGNESLAAEIVRTLELAYTYASQKLFLSASAYLLRTSDVITRIKLDSDQEPRYRNVDGYWRFGGELDFQLSLISEARSWMQSLKLLANLGYNHQGNTVVAEDPLVRFVPRLQVNFGLTWTFFDRHTLGGSQRLLSPRGEVGWQHITTLAYSLRYRSVTLFAHLNNVANHRIVDPDINANAIPQVPGGAGRSLFVGARYRL